jgi:hypothetical protein
MVPRSTHALDLDGRIFVWGKRLVQRNVSVLLRTAHIGTLDAFANAEFTARYDAGWIAEEPHLLRLPTKIKRIRFAYFLNRSSRLCSDFDQLRKET